MVHTTSNGLISVILAIIFALSSVFSFVFNASAGAVVKCKIDYSGDKVTVTLTPQSSSNTIYYTTDGTTPTTSSKKYKKTLSFSKKVRVKAIEYDKNGKKTASMNAVVKPKVQSPQLRITSVSDGTKFVSATCPTKNAVIRYTLDGSEPTSSSPRLKDRIPYTDGTTVTVCAFKSGMSASVSVRYNSLGEAAMAGTDETPEQGILSVLEIMNEERTSRGIPALTLDDTLCEAAAVRAKEITEVFEHVRPDGSICSTVLKDFGVNYKAEGENIAKGQNTGERAMERWMDSPGHRANILEKSFGKVGIGCYVKDGVKYWVQLFTN